MKKEKINKALKVLYWVIFGFLLVLAGLIIFSTFNIPGNYSIFTVESGSMEPKIKTGSVVVVKPQEEYEVGDVVSFRSSLREDVPTTHRIRSVREVNGEKRFTTKGDANNAPDRREVKEGEVIGKVLLSVPYLGHLISTARKPLGFALIIVLPAAFIIFDESKNIYKEVQKSKRGKKNSETDEKQEKEIKKLKSKVKELEKEKHEK